MKVCRLCEQSLPLSEFEPRSDCNTLRRECRECRCRAKRVAQGQGAGWVVPQPCLSRDVDRGVSLTWRAA